MKPIRCKALVIAVVATASYGLVVHGADQAYVQRFFAKNKVGRSPDIAVMKNGTDHLMTIHGYMDDLAVCEQLIEPYNQDSSLSTLPGSYSCVPLNQ